MEPKWAEENLKTIRILMERSAIYRRALAPIMLFAGFVGLLAATFGILSSFDFGYLWLFTAIFAFVGALLITRRQAIKAKEPFWSPPTKRVVYAILPSLLTGLATTPVIGVVSMNNDQLAWWLLPIWMVLYGFALHCAGFFTPKSIGILGIIFLFLGLFGIVLLPIESTFGTLPLLFYANYFMGFFFGVLHLAYGAYLYLTEKKNLVA